MSFDLETVLSVLLGGFMVVGFFVNIPAKDTTRAQFKLWGYPEWFHIVTAILELIAAGLIFYQGTRLYGSALATVIMIFAVVTLWRHKEFAHSIPAVIALILLVLLCFVVIVTP